MKETIRVDKIIHKKIVFLIERLRNWPRNHLPYKFRRWFIRVIGYRFPGNLPSNIRPEKFLRGSGRSQVYKISAKIPPATPDRDLYQNKYGKTVVIIPTCKNLEYLKLCLDSIWDKTDYPRYEVIVVNNGSESDIIDYLLALEQQEPRLRVIINNENFGFARAVNIGIEAAGKCEYIVLLNDDTIVTCGWLSKLVSHLKKTNIKLVGPVTNWAGNEACIKVDYDDLDSLERFSSDYCLSHEGHFFDVPMLAMYCVIMRRSLFDEIGALDERFGIGMFEDDDFSLRVRKSGGRVICVEDVFIHHWGKTTIGRLHHDEYDRIFDENRKKFEEKWQITWQSHHVRF